LKLCFLRLYIQIHDSGTLRGFVLCLLVGSWLLMVGACSIEQNTVTSNIFHNTTAHYNGYFYAREKTREVETAIGKTLDDDPNYILALFPRLDTNLAKTYAKDTEEIIKMASISIQRHPNSKWLYDNYLLVGLARLYACDYLNASLTFKYVNKQSKNGPLRHRAMIYLIRTFTEQGQYDQASDVFSFLEKESLNRANAKDLYLEKAHYYQLQGDYDNMVRNLTGADSLLTRGDQKARLYFIVGQVYQKLGFNSEAYNYYKKCIAAHPTYEIEFYARLNIAQVTKLDDTRNVKQARKQFLKLLTDTKNAEFKDKIYYEFGEFERKQNHLTEAIDNYKAAAHEGKNKRIQGSAFLRIGQIQFDYLKNYKLAKAYYDSALTLLPKDFEQFNLHKKRADVLADFVKYTETIVLQDSLLRLSTLDSATIRKELDSVYAGRLAKKAAEKKKRRGGSTSGTSGRASSITPLAGGAASPDWYFDNPASLAAGESEFTRVWGNIPLEDNWRRSSRSQLDAGNAAAPVATATGATPVDAPVAAQAEPKDPVTDLYAKLLPQLPKTEQAKSEALKKIEDAYFQLGDLYFLKLNERVNAVDSYEKLVKRFPESALLPEVLYKLYLIEKDHDPERSRMYAEQLMNDFPESTFAKILVNPNYIKEISVAAEQQKLIYKRAYEAFAKGNLRVAAAQLSEAESLGETGFTPQLALLRVLITGKTEDITRYQFELGEFAKKYPESSLKVYAENLLSASKSFQEKQEKARGIRFQNSWQGPMVFVMVHQKDDKLSDKATDYLEKLLASVLPKNGPKSTNLVFNEESNITILSEFPDIESARLFYTKFTEADASRNPLTGYKFDTFVISKDNFQIFYRTKALDEYLTFFDRNFQIKNP
jgi:tetratricopeptide (TPR) repeat protein